VRRVELATLIFILFGILAFGLGIVLYILRRMAELAVAWEIQLAILGFIVFLLAIVMSKLLSKVNFDE
jgi:hypothetical protein